MNNNESDDNIVKFPGANPESKQTEQRETVHEALSQDPYYKFIHDLLFAIESVGLPLDKDAKDKARELYAKYKRENLIAKWDRELQAEREAKQKKSNKPELLVVKNANQDNDTHSHHDKA